MNASELLLRPVRSLILFAGLGATASADVIDFSVVDEFTSVGLIERIGDAHFSFDLYNHSDGFILFSDPQWPQYTQGAYNYYGENKEYIDFAEPVFFNSIDLAQFDVGLPLPDSVILNFYDDQQSLIESIVVLATPTVETIWASVPGVSRLEFEFTGGELFYSDDRDHAWYFIDNIVTDEPPLNLRATPDTAFPGDPIDLRTGGGAPGLLNLLVATDVSGVPSFFKIDIGLFDARCERTFTAPVPSGLSGLAVRFRSFGFAKTGRLEISNEEQILFQ